MTSDVSVVAPYAEAQPERELSRRHLLEDYVHRAEARPLAAEATAIRMLSRSTREFFAYGATGGHLSASELDHAIRAGQTATFSPEWLARYARVVALQHLDDDDPGLALKGLQASLPALPCDKKTIRHFKLLAELLYEHGRRHELLELLHSRPRLRGMYDDYLMADANNPHVWGDEADATAWQDDFNKPFVASGRRPLLLDLSSGSPFDDLSAGPNENVGAHGPLVTVVMTTYRPERSELMNSVRSILEQSWQNLELIVVDDASGIEFAGVLQDVSQLDSRIRTVILEENGGTYRARNAALAVARGEFITGQDDDDWSHPDRLAAQVERFLSEEEEPSGVLTYGMRTNDQLSRVFRGKPPVSECAASLMVRTSSARELGGYIEVRKAADNEFRHRVEAYYRSDVQVIKEPLYLIRVLPDSLSRGDFATGWVHPARHAFRGAYTYWHTTSSPKQLCQSGDEPSPLPVPRRFQIEPQQPGQLDVVFAGDWKQLGGPQYSMLNEIAACRKMGWKVGVMDLDAARFLSVGSKQLCSPVQELINSGEVTQVFNDEPSETQVLVIRYPPIFQFISDERTQLKFGRFILVANQAPSERDGTDIRYLPWECADNAEKMFGERPLWVPQGPTVRAALDGLLPADEVAAYDMPGIIDAAHWRMPRSRPQSTQQPIIGRHSRDNHMKWPEDPRTFEQVYPTDSSIDLRIMGGAGVPLRVLGESRAPASWVVFGADEMSARAFLGSIDFFVYYQHSQAYDAFGRSVLEALAAGCVAILPVRFESTFGKAAIYAEPEEVQATVHRYARDSEAFKEQAERAMHAVRESFSYTMYQSLLKQFMESPVREDRNA